MPFVPSRSQVPRLIVDTNSTLGNESTDTTTITGSLLLKGNAVVSGTGYVNFGALESTSGYGFRDNAGSMEFKNSGGSWGAFGSSAGAVTSYTNTTNNRVITSAGTTVINGEANLTFDGSTLTVTGDAIPGAANTHNIGASDNRWQSIYAQNVHTGDLHLKNHKGDWTVIEEESFLTIRNNKSGKLYKLIMEELEQFNLYILTERLRNNAFHVFLKKEENNNGKRSIS